jgi:hypothetical protein
MKACEEDIKICPKYEKLQNIQTCNHFVDPFINGLSYNVIDNA